MGIFGSLAGGIIQGISANKAAKAQKSAANDQIALQRDIYNQQKELFAPFVGAGTNALSAYNYELGLGPRPTFGGTAPQITTITDQPVALQEPMRGVQFGRRNEDASTGYQRQASPVTRYSVNGQMFNTMDAAQSYANANKTGGTAYGGFQATPGYQFQLDQGLGAIDRSAASRGGLFSGATLKAAQGYGQGLANQEYGTYLNRLSGLAGSGQAAAGQQGAAAQNYGAGASNALANYGNASAAGAIGFGNAINSGIGNALGVWQYMKGLG